ILPVWFSIPPVCPEGGFMFGPIRKPARLGRWDGRKRSTRSEEPLWVYLCRRPVLLRLGLVFLTTLAMTLLVYAWGLPFPYRVGEIYAYDLCVRVAFSVETPVEPISPPAETVPPDRVRAMDRPVLERYVAGTILVQRNTPITERQLTLLKE